MLVTGSSSLFTCILVKAALREILDWQRAVLNLKVVWRSAKTISGDGFVTTPGEWLMLGLCADSGEDII